jgi:hypothetical protein
MNSGMNVLDVMGMVGPFSHMSTICIREDFHKCTWKGTMFMQVPWKLLPFMRVYIYTYCNMSLYQFCAAIHEALVIKVACLN